MAETADSVAIELEGRFAKFKADSKGAADSFDRDVDRIARGAGKAEDAVTQASGKMYNAFGNAGARSRQLGIQIGQLGSSLASGMNPMVVLSQQASDFAYVLGGTQGVAGRVATFFSGPWGAALLAATLVVGVLSQKLLQHKDTEETVTQALEKRRKQTELNRLTDEAWGRTIDGLIEKNQKLAEELRKRLTVQSVADRQALAGQQGRVDAAYRAMTDAENRGAPDVEKFRKEYSIEVGKLRDLQFLVGQQMGQAMSDLNARATQWAETQGQVIQTIMGYHPELLKFSTDLNAATNSLAQATTHAAGAGVNFEGTIADAAKLNKGLLDGSITVKTYTTEIRKLATALEAAAEAAKKTASGTGQVARFIMPVEGPVTSGFGARTPPTKGASSFHPAIDIGAVAGTPVKAAAGGTVITAGRLGGLGNVVIIDHGGGTITEYGHLSAIVAQRGQSVAQGDVIGSVGSTGISTGPHLDYRMKVGGKYVDPRTHATAPVDEVASAQKAAEAAERAQREADAAAVREQQFNAEMAGMEQRLLGATRDRLASADQQFEWAQQDIEAERQNAETAYRSALTAHRIDEAQFKLLAAKNNQLADAKLEAATTAERRRQADMSMGLNAQYQQFQIDDLKHEQSHAKSSSERLDVALRLLTAEQALERIMLQRIIDNTAEGTYDHELAQLKLDRLNRERGQKEKEIRDDPANRSPGQLYRDQLKKTAGQIDDAMEQISVDGLEKLNDELTSAIMGTESLGEAFDNVANQIIAALIKIAIQQAIIKPLADLIFGKGAGDGGVSAGSGSGGLISAAASFIGGLFGHRATGGPVSAGGAYWVGENGPEPFFPSQSGTIMPNQEAARMLQGGGAAPKVSVALTVNAPGATAETVAMIRRELAAAAPTLVAASTRATMSTLQRTRA